MPGYAASLSPPAARVALCVGACLSTEGYYRYQDAGPSGRRARGAGTGGATRAPAGRAPRGRPAAGGRGSAATATGRGGAAGNAGTTGRGGTTGAAAAAGRRDGGAWRRRRAAGGLRSDGQRRSRALCCSWTTSKPASSKWDFGSAAARRSRWIGDGGPAPRRTAGDQKRRRGAAWRAGRPIIRRGEGKGAVLHRQQLVDIAAICARLASGEYVLLPRHPERTKALKIKINNGSNSSIGSSHRLDRLRRQHLGHVAARRPWQHADRLLNGVKGRARDRQRHPPDGRHGPDGPAHQRRVRRRRRSARCP